MTDNVIPFPSVPRRDYFKEALNDIFEDILSDFNYDDQGQIITSCLMIYFANYELYSTFSKGDIQGVINRMIPILLESLTQINIYDADAKDKLIIELQQPYDVEIIDK